MGETPEQRLAFEGTVDWLRFDRNRIHSSCLLSSSKIFRLASMRSRHPPEETTGHKLKTFPIFIVSVQKRRNRFPKLVFSRFNIAPAIAVAERNVLNPVFQVGAVMETSGFPSLRWGLHTIPRAWLPKTKRWVKISHPSPTTQGRHVQPL